MWKVTYYSEEMKLRLRFGTFKTKSEARAAQKTAIRDHDLFLVAVERTAK